MNSADRCVSFWYAPDHFEQIARDAGVRHAKRTFPELRVPALKELSPLLTRACIGLSGALSALAWEELSIHLAALTTRLVYGVGTLEQPSAMDQARVTHVIRAVEWEAEHPWTLIEMSEAATLSPHHFLRTFEAVAGVTPHQYILRTRLREAALRILNEPEKIVDIALGCGFGDVSNFNRAFRNEFGVSPREWRSSANTHIQSRVFGELNGKR